MQMPRVIVVMGVSGSGKSTVAAALALKNGGKFYDADDFHPEANIRKMACGDPLDDNDRWPWLEILKTKVIDAAAPGEFAVLACSALKKSYRDKLGVGENGVTLVYLEGSPELLLRRLQSRHGHYMKAGMLDSQLADLEPPSSEEGVTVSIDQPVEQIVAEIERKLGIEQQA